MTDEEIEQGRNDSVRRILESDARAKVVVRGPGTGKTFTFGEVIDRTKGGVLVMSFLGTLVEDLVKDLGDRAEVYTFHGFSRRLLHANTIDGITRDVDYYPALSLLVAEDLNVCGTECSTRDIDARFMNLDESDGLAASALRVGGYYNAVGHTDAVYRLYRALVQDPGIVPRYALILVDEYQDFSLLEVSMIHQLAAVSPTLIAGDDDQALYSFKHASAHYLRQLVSGEEYEKFELPYCSRCTAVLVEATHRVVKAAQDAGLLADRIDKRYECFLPSKRAASEAFPRIIHARCSVERNGVEYVCRYVAEQIGRIPTVDVATSRADGHPTVLVVGPVQFVRRVHRHLEALGLPNLDFRKSPELAPEVIDAYRRLTINENSRLAWRILLYVFRPAGWDECVRRAHFDAVELAESIDPAFKAQHLANARSVAVLLAGEALDADATAALENSLGQPIDAILQLLGLVEIEPADEHPDAPTVVLTSLVGAKGLQAEHVFIVGVNEGHFPRQNDDVTDDEACCLLVALTRARQSCTLVSCNRFGNQKLSQSVFLTWLHGLTDYRYIDAKHWKP